MVAAVEIFSCFPGCADAKKAKAYLEERDVEYTEFDCSKASDIEECQLSDMSIFVVRTSLSSLSFRCSDVLTSAVNRALQNKLNLAS